MEEYYPAKKMNFKQWIANFWYYHKWLFLSVLVVILFMGISMVQYMTKSDADLSLLYVGPTRVTQADCDATVFEAENRIYDVNGDGDVFVDMKTIILHSDPDSLPERERIRAIEEYQKYLEEILSGDACFLLLDPGFFEKLMDAGALVNLYEIFPEPPSGSLEDYGVRLASSPLYRLDGFSKLPPETVLCLKYAPVVTANDLEHRVEIDENNILLFQKLYGVN